MTARDSAEEPDELTRRYRDALIEILGLTKPWDRPDLERSRDIARQALDLGQPDAGQGFAPLREAAEAERHRTAPVEALLAGGPIEVDPRDGAAAIGLLELLIGGALGDPCDCIACEQLRWMDNAIRHGQLEGQPPSSVRPRHHGGVVPLPRRPRRMTGKDLLRPASRRFGPYPRRG